MKVIAIQPGFFNARVYEAGEVFEIEAKEGFKLDGHSKKLVPTKISVDEQFSEKWMKKLDESEALGLEVKSEVIPDAAPKKKGRPFAQKVESNNLEVI